MKRTKRVQKWLTASLILSLSLGLTLGTPLRLRAEEVQPLEALQPLDPDPEPTDGEPVAPPTETPTEPPTEAPTPPSPPPTEPSPPPSEEPGEEPVIPPAILDPTPEPESDPDATEAPEQTEAKRYEGENFQLLLNGLDRKTYHSNTVAQLEKPEDYSKVTYPLIDGKEIEALSSEENQNLPLVYLSEGQQSPRLYLLDVSKRAVYPYYEPLEITLEGDKKERIYPISLLRPEADFQFTTRNLENKLISVLEGRQGSQTHILVQVLRDRQMKLFQLLGDRPPYKLEAYSKALLQTETSATTTAATSGPTLTTAPAPEPQKAGIPIFAYLAMGLLLLLMLGGGFYLAGPRRKLSDEDSLEEYWDETEALGQAELRDLEPNNFDQVDDYFAQKPESKEGARSASLGLRRPEIRLRQPGEGLAAEEGEDDEYER